MSMRDEEAYSKMWNKKGLGWIAWLRGCFHLMHDMLFQRIMTRHLHNPMPLPPLHPDFTCLVTGCTNGIGREIARQLAEAGAHVVMAVRNTTRANVLIEKWQCDWSKMSLPLNIEVMELNLLSLDSVARFAEAWNARSVPLHVLINNAGIFSIGEPQKISKDGFEEHMQVNHLAPALLSILLLPSLIRGSPSRIVNVSSTIHHVGFVDPEDMNVSTGKRKYTNLAGYSGSKLAQVMFSSILNKKLPSKAGISVVCVSPGVVQTNFARDLSKIVQIVTRLFPYYKFSPEEGARSALFAATDTQISEFCKKLESDDWPVCAFISHECRPTNPSEEAHNLETSYNVWEKTMEMIGLPSDTVQKLIEGQQVKCRYGSHQD
ncbi:dehydrogenase/reductase SDR family member FEY-like [Daucus carota subsp. sativus]|nr:PREDICTED: retinol dehydrogenase 12-like [Daucus carota subsp. sativus]